MKKITILISVLLLTVCIDVDLIPCAACNPLLAGTGSYGGGNGTDDNPYQIYTAEQMNAIGANPNDWDKNFILMEDIDLSEYKSETFNIIGSYTDNSNNHPFSGVFDGNGNTIKNLSYTSTDKDYVGIFGYVSGTHANIKNLNMTYPNIQTGGDCVGSLVGFFRNGTISYCRIKNCNISGANYLGGLVGRASYDPVAILYCSSSGYVSGDNYIGGLLGHIGPGNLNQSYSNTDVSGNNSVGGLVGKTGDKTSNVTDCYATGDVEGNEYVGGLTGHVQLGTVYKCYSVGRVSGNRYTGGFTGYVRLLGNVERCFWDTQTSGQTDSAGGTGKTTAQMKTIDTFTAWNFWITWSICDQMNYPVFQWQIPAGDFLCPDGVDFIDFSFFAQHWQNTNCNETDYCSGADMNQSGSVDFDDFSIFVENWLEGT